MMIIMIFQYLAKLKPTENSELEQNYIIYFLSIHFFLIVGQQKCGPPQPVGVGGGVRRIPFPMGLSWNIGRTNTQNLKEAQSIFNTCKILFFKRIKGLTVQHCVSPSRLTNSLNSVM